MTLCPFATQKPVTAHGGPMSGHLGVVIHVTAGEGDPYNEFANPANQVSSHFGIGNGQGGMGDGVIEQYVDTDFESWAQMAGNPTYISVETEGQPTDPLTPAQVAAFGRLYAWIAQTHSIPFVITDIPGQPGFITHGDGGADWGGHTGCPGTLRAGQRQQILDLAKPAPFVPTPNITGRQLAVFTLSSDNNGTIYGCNGRAKWALSPPQAAVCRAAGVPNVRLAHDGDDGYPLVPETPESA